MNIVLFSGTALRLNQTKTYLLQTCPQSVWGGGQPPVRNLNSFFWKGEKDAKCSET